MLLPVMLGKEKRDNICFVRHKDNSDTTPSDTSPGGTQLVIQHFKTTPLSKTDMMTDMH